MTDSFTAAMGHSNGSPVQDSQDWPKEFLTECSSFCQKLEEAVCAHDRNSKRHHDTSDVQVLFWSAGPNMDQCPQLQPLMKQYKLKMSRPREDWYLFARRRSTHKYNSYRVTHSKWLFCFIFIIKYIVVAAMTDKSSVSSNPEWQEECRSICTILEHELREHQRNGSPNQVSTSGVCLLYSSSFANLCQCPQLKPILDRERLHVSQHRVHHMSHGVRRPGLTRYLIAPKQVKHK